jgi:hypothetical protein
MDGRAAGEACGKKYQLQEWAGRDVIGCTSSASDEDDELYLPPPHALTTSGDQPAPRDAGRCCCCCPLAPLEGQTRAVCAALVAHHGWEAWPAEVVAGGPVAEGRGQPRGGLRVGFSNAAFHSGGFVMSDEPCERLFDRLALAHLGCPLGLCPPTVACPAGQPDAAADELVDAAAAAGRVCFTKQNFEHFGTGTRVYPSLATALAAAAEGAGDCVVQPHIERPLLIDRRKFHVRVYVLVVRRATHKGLEAWLHNGGTLALAAADWSPTVVDRAVQLSNPVSRDRPYWTWPGRAVAHRAITANASRLLKALSVEVAAADPPYKRRDHFSLAGLDYMLTTDYRPWLLEVFNGPIWTWRVLPA